MFCVPHEEHVDDKRLNADAAAPRMTKPNTKFGQVFGADFGPRSAIVGPNSVGIAGIWQSHNPNLVELRLSIGTNVSSTEVGLQST